MWDPGDGLGNLQKLLENSTAVVMPADSDYHAHDWASPTKKAARAEIDRFRNLGQANCNRGCRCAPYEIQVKRPTKSKRKYFDNYELLPYFMDDYDKWKIWRAAYKKPTASLGDGRFF